MVQNIKVMSARMKSGKQEVLGVQVFVAGKEFVFNYNTARTPSEDEITLLKDFRNEFVKKLETLNTLLDLKVQ